MRNPADGPHDAARIVVGSRPALQVAGLLKHAITIKASLTDIEHAIVKDAMGR
ncbi:hypothetical protein [Paracoccus nototheniae]|uniref:Uncharacterized protein n=1 Tax=Paracoccus nototheniae TaxID=2489002 RepID=A0ABW4DYV1_9RHOB|nr:hypothetical protein [Paracoccus nototheniae]